MKPSRLLLLSLTVLSAFFLAAELPPIKPPSEKLPASYYSLVPKGYTLRSPSTNKNTQGSGGMSVSMANIEFSATKEFKDRHSGYHFKLFFYQFPALMMPTYEKAYRAGLAKDIEDTRRHYQESTPDNPVMMKYDELQEKKYDWGWGITRRETYNWNVDTGQPPIIVYSGEYHGLIMVTGVMKKFEFSGGAPSRGEIDQWAQKAAETIKKTTLADIP